MAYGGVRISGPSHAPPGGNGPPRRKNCTPGTPMSSEAFAATTTLEPETAPAAGAVSDTVGGVASFATVTRTALANPVAAVLSVATAERKCVPFAVVVVSQETA